MISRFLYLCWLKIQMFLVLRKREKCEKALKCNHTIAINISRKYRDIIRELNEIIRKVNKQDPKAKLREFPVYED